MLCFLGDAKLAAGYIWAKFFLLCFAFVYLHANGLRVCLSNSAAVTAASLWHGGGGAVRGFNLLITNTCVQMLRAPFLVSRPPDFRTKQHRNKTFFGYSSGMVDNRKGSDFLPRMHQREASRSHIPLRHCHLSVLVLTGIHAVHLGKLAAHSVAVRDCCKLTIRAVGCVFCLRKWLKSSHYRRD